MADLACRMYQTQTAVTAIMPWFLLLRYLAENDDPEWVKTKYAKGLVRLYGEMVSTGTPVWGVESNFLPVVGFKLDQTNHTIIPQEIERNTMQYDVLV